MRLVSVLCLFVLAGCDTNSDVGWIAFNADDQSLEIQVTASEEVGEDATLGLVSTTGTVEVGDAMVSPGSGPIGTEHQIVINVLDDYEEEVGRVTVETTGDRGEQTHLMVQDSADHGLWQIEVTSLGAEGEERTDDFRVRLWRAADEDEEADPEAETEDP
ncbi:MAG: hypothetical protein AB8H79_10375 [Myxococcota bacterium]